MANTFPHSRLRWRAALSLNNTAVSMLQHEHYKEAMETLKMGLEMLRAPEGCSGSNDIAPALHRVQVMLSQQKTKLPSASANSVCSTERTVVVQPVCSDIHLAIIGDVLLSEPTSQDRNYIVHPIYIDSSDIDSCNSLSKEEGYVLLFNYGIAYSCCAFYGNSEKRLLVNAFRIFQNVQYWTGSHHSKHSDLCFAPIIQIIHLLLLHSLRQTSVWLGQYEWSTGYDQNLREWIHYTQDREALFFPKYQCAPAA